MNSVRLHDAFLLRDIATGQSGLHASDKIFFFREVTFDVNGEAVITDIQLLPGAKVCAWIGGWTTACAGTDAGSTFGTLAISITDGNICISRADVAAQAGTEAPAVVMPFEDATSETLPVLLMVKPSDLGVL